MRDLLAPATVEQLRRIAAGASRGARHAAWALEAFDGDEEQATAALIDARRVASARQSLAYVRANPMSAAYVPRWEAHVARLERLFAARPTEPAIPSDLVAWVYRRLELEQDVEPAALLARKVGARGTFVGTARLRPGADLERAADAVALANDVFPIGAGWVPLDLAAAEAQLAYDIGHDLAYRTPRASEARARARARRFLALFGPSAHFFSNTTTATRVDANGQRRASRAWAPLTLFTFDSGLAAVGAGRAGVVALTGED